MITVTFRSFLTALSARDTVFAHGLDVQSYESRSSNEPASSTPLGRTFPIGWLLLYYAALIAVAAGIAVLLPDAAPTVETPVVEPRAEDVLKTSAPTVPASNSWRAITVRTAGAVGGMLWALAMALPVAWTLKHTRKLRYDPSLVQTLIILPIVVAAIVLVVKNSLALAFALAGIVAGVRFRQKLDEPEQAVYVLLSLGIGLAAGVHSLDIALAMSLVFTVVVLSFWRYDIGEIFAGGRGAQLSMGDTRFLQSRREADAIEAAETAGLSPNGILVVSTADPEAARAGLEIVLGRMAKRWHFGEPVAPRGWGPSRISIPVELKDKADPSELIAELEARMTDHLSAAEYTPIGNRADLG